ncbi:MAG: aminopeptidase P family protein [Bryobacterales bacterium]|nr:aminopeptidase P family protein [Bryobacterales bacterium]
MVPLAEIQDALRARGIPGWLFYDHHKRDPLAYRILRFEPHRTPTRRWYYFIPAVGEPVALVHRVEPNMLDDLPGRRLVYSSWQTMCDGLRQMLGAAREVAMQWSPQCAIPYVSLVDGGMIDLVRGFDVEVVSSADLVQYFEARWSEAQFDMHVEAGRRVDAARRAAFRNISEAVRNGTSIDEYQVACFLRDFFASNGLFTDHGPIVAVNANASNPHYEPEPTRTTTIRSGDVVLIDLWAKLTQPDSVYYDITWTGYCGRDIPAQVQKVFAVVKGARDAAVRFIKDGIAAGRTLRGYEVDDTARGFITNQGYGDSFIHRTGHSIGAEVHGTGANMDNLESHDTRQVIPHTCFSIEPGVYLEHFGIRSEVNVYVGEKEAMVTGEIQEALLEL